MYEIECATSAVKKFHSLMCKIKYWIAVAIDTLWENQRPVMVGKLKETSAYF